MRGVVPAGAAARCASSAATTAAYCAGALPPTLTMTGCRSAAHSGSRSIQAWMPGFSRPMALIMPAGVSVTRGAGLPVRASAVTVLGTYAANGKSAK